MEHLLRLRDISGQDLADILDLADQLKYERTHGIPHPLLAGKTLGMIFQKPSTRTRVSFEAGMYQLGGSALFLSAGDLQIGRGEPIEDTARALSRYLDCIMVRAYAQQDADDLARHGTVPVINGLTDHSHPCQVLADLMTIREYKGGLKGLKLGYIGDGNNMANSLIAGAVLSGMGITLACPGGYRPNSEVLSWAAWAGGDVTVTDDISEAARGADALCTDVWSSMGMEAQAQRRLRDFKGYQINAALLELARPDVIVLHCLPAHRGEEITAEVFEAHAGEIFDEAENRLHAQKAVLVKLLSPPAVT
jgi:ornithine carbamoyltransferase